MCLIPTPHIGSMQRGSSGQIIAERGFQVASELFQGKLVGLILFTQRIDREVQIPSLSATDTVDIDVEQFLGSLDGQAVGSVPGEAPAQGEVGFGRNPVLAVAVSFVDAFDVFGRTGRNRPSVPFLTGSKQGSPAGLAGISFLIAHPAHVGSRIAENHGIGLQFAAESIDVFPVVVVEEASAVFIGTAIISVTTLTRSTVEPDDKEIAVLGEQFPELCLEHIQVFGSAELSRIAVPGRKVNPELQPVLAAGCLPLAYPVAFSVAPGRTGDIVVGRAGRPHTEASVVFRIDEESLRSGFLGTEHDLFGIEVYGIDDLGRLVAPAPVFIKVIDLIELNHVIHLHLMPLQLAL